MIVNWRKSTKDFLSMTTNKWLPVNYELSNGVQWKTAKKKYVQSVKDFQPMMVNQGFLSSSKTDGDIKHQLLFSEIFQWSSIFGYVDRRPAHLLPLQSTLRLDTSSLDTKSSNKSSDQTAIALMVVFLPKRLCRRSWKSFEVVATTQCNIHKFLVSYVS